MNHVASASMAIEVAVESITSLTNTLPSSLPVAGSSLTTPLMPPSQIAPASTAIEDDAPWPSASRFVARVFGSIRVTSPRPRSRAHSARSPIVRTTDSRRTESEPNSLVWSVTVPRSSPSSGPISRTARRSPWFTATQTEPSPTASPIGIPSAGIPRVGCTTSRAFGSIDVSVRAFGSRTQTKPSPEAISDDSNPTGMSATISRLVGSITPTDIGRTPESPSERPTSTSAATTAATSTAAAAAPTPSSRRDRASRRARARGGRVGRCSSPSAALAEATSSPQLSYLPAGSFARARAMTGSSSYPRPGSGGVGSWTWAHSVATSDSRAKGRSPDRHSYSTQPSEYWSARPSTGSPRICSGETYSTVPTSSPVPVRPEIEDVCFVRPKSVR